MILYVQLVSGFCRNWRCFCQSKQKNRQKRGSCRFFVHHAKAVPIKFKGGRKLKNNPFFKDKSYGFYVTLALIVLTVATAVMYAVLYHGSRYLSTPAVIIMLGGAAISLALCFTKYAKWACAVLALADFAGLLLYIYGIYFYVSIVMVGIQASSFNWQFLLCTTVLAVLLVINVVNVFLKQVNEEED